ncbi:MAG: 3-dehydroquinate synthase [Crocinitomicaceae bacterium]|nr:3-dehydroquinate synthase [Crocinitomicaceae bacterium]
MSSSINDSVIFTSSAFEELSKYLNAHYRDHKKVVLIDENVNEIWGEKFLVDVQPLYEAEVIVIPAGEETKDIEICKEIWDTLLSYQIPRNTVMINIGGGVTTDLGGFIASTYKRGIDFINVPTSLMAQVDASHGGKTGIDFAGLKNVIGTFELPKTVIVDPQFLQTLPEEEVLSGFAEMLKHGLIRDKHLWLSLIESKGKLEKIYPLVEKCARVKHEIVAQDIKESGLRKVLNLGHTIGHGIESSYLATSKAITHGTGVAWGILFESKLALNKGLVTAEIFQEIKTGLESIYPLPALNDLDIPLILNFLQNDKKNDNNAIKLVLLKDFGDLEMDVEASTEEIIDAIKTSY